MFLSHRYKFLFVHVAKTGGTSIRHALDALRWRDPLYYLVWPAHKINSATGHKLGLKFPRHARAVAALEMLPKDYYDSLFKFAFVRNPWDLQVSSFHHILQERPQFMNGLTDFKRFMAWKFDPDRPYQYHIDTSLTLQSDYIVDLHGNVIVDYIGRFEHLYDDFDSVCQRLNLNVKLPHRRKSESRKSDYRIYYNDAVAEMVANHFARDIEMFDYEFDRVE